MPKLNNRPPKYSKQGKFAVVYYGKKLTISDITVLLSPNRLSSVDR